MSSLKPITLYTHTTGPNPWKVAIILEELDLPYEKEFVDFSKIKEAPYTDLNPNGRVPTIVDPNNGDFSIWESGAIIQYLVDRYDAQGKISSKSAPEKYLENQWLHFQASGQGPYYGQAAWFQHFHSEALPSARQRYIKEIQRVMMVLDNALKGKKYLLGDKCSYVDLSFVPWADMVGWIMKGEKLESEGQYKDYDRWLSSLGERPSVKKIRADKMKAMSSH